MKRWVTAILVFWMATLSLSPFDATGQSIEHFYVKAQGGNWRSDAEQFLNKHKPEPCTVSGGFSGDYDFHIFAASGSFNGSYKLTSFKTPEWANITSRLIAGGKAKLIGFSGPDVWVLVWE